MTKSIQKLSKFGTAIYNVICPKYNPKNAWLSLRFFDGNKRLEKAYYSNTLQRSQKCFRFSASVHFNQLFLRTNRNQIQHIRQPKTVQKEIWNIKKCIQRVGSSSTTCFTKNIQNRFVISNSNKRWCYSCYWFRLT